MIFAVTQLSNEPIRYKNKYFKCRAASSGAWLINKPINSCHFRSVYFSILPIFSIYSASIAKLTLKFVVWTLEVFVVRDLRENGRKGSKES